MTSEREQILRRLTLIGTVMDTVLSALKLTVGLAVQSTALVADGIHSLSDLVSDILILIMTKVSHQAPDEGHPYGHGRFETLATVILGMILFAVGAGMMVEYSELLFADGDVANKSWLAIVIVIISMLGKEWLFHYTMGYAKKTQSKMLEANAWHSRSDSLSSFVVLIGLVASMLGFPKLEVIAALFVALLIIKMGFSLTWGAIQELMDRGVDEATIKKITEAIEQTPGVKNLHQLRSRFMANQIFLDAHIQVDRHISVSEGHQINEWVMAKLHENVDSIGDITLHIDPEDDSYTRAELLPLRQEIETQLANYRDLNQAVERVIHYHLNRIQLELIFDSEQDLTRLQAEVEALKKEYPMIETVRLLSLLK